MSSSPDLNLCCSRAFSGIGEVAIERKEDVLDLGRARRTPPGCACDAVSPTRGKRRRPRRCSGPIAGSLPPAASTRWKVGALHPCLPLDEACVPRVEVVIHPGRIGGLSLADAAQSGRQLLVPARDVDQDLAHPPGAETGPAHLLVAQAVDLPV